MSKVQRARPDTTHAFEIALHVKVRAFYEFMSNNPLQELPGERFRASMGAELQGLGLWIWGSGCLGKVPGGHEACQNCW